MNALLRAALVALFPVLTLFAGTTHAQALPLPPCLQDAGTGKCYSPVDIRSLYGVSGLLNKGVTGKGRTIAIIVSYGSPTIRSDLHTFDQTFGLPDPQLTIAAPLGQAQPTTKEGQGWLIETSLDVEWAHVIAPGAKILLLTSPVNETEGIQGMPQFLTLLRYAQSHGADVISQSWAVSEPTLKSTKKGRSIVAQFHAFYTAASTKGISLVGGSGDSGTMGLDDSLKNYFTYRVAQFPASDPHVIAVGGTLISADSAGALSEVAWSGSGGGLSTFFSQPAYQRALPARDQKLVHGRRAYPDVAYDASNKSPFPVMIDGQWLHVGGTSAGTPQWAGILALADSAAGKRLGDIHSALYAIARSSRYHADFHDITSGSIVDPPEIAGTVPPFRATAGWDLATGLGTPNVAHLVADLVKHAR
jgi:subtilase family serine protease